MKSEFFGRYLKDESPRTIPQDVWQKIRGLAVFPLTWGSYEVFDFTQTYDPHRALKHPYGVGRYNERRPTMYVGESYEVDQRDVHVGIDLASHEGASVKLPFTGTCFMSGILEAPYDYGGTIIFKHEYESHVFYSLYGHLSHSSVSSIVIGNIYPTGAIIGRLGSTAENGGWNPHLHLQLSLCQPLICDLPGVVSGRDLDLALKIFPDPQLIIGSLYPEFK